MVVSNQVSTKFLGGTVFGFAIGVAGFFLFSYVLSMQSTISFVSVEAATAETRPQTSTIPSSSIKYSPNYAKFISQLKSINNRLNTSWHMKNISFNDTNITIEYNHLISQQSQIHNINTNKDENNQLTQSINEFMIGASQGLQFIMKKSNEINANPMKNKISFIAGIEGSGHHLWLAIMKAMNQASELIVTQTYDKSQLATQLQKCWMDKSPQGCDLVQTELKKLQTEKYENTNKILLQDNSLLHLRSYSFPFKGLKLSNFPNIAQLTQLVQDSNKLARIFDLKIIVMRRNWIECLVSSCVHRFGQCDNRIQYLPLALRILQSQLLAIDPKFWIMIDYNDLMHRPSEYVPIISKFLEIDQNIVETGFNVIDSKKINQNKAQLTDEQRTQAALNELRNNRGKANAIREFINSYNKQQLFLFNSDYFVVTPENTAFLDSKFE